LEWVPSRVFSSTKTYDFHKWSFDPGSTVGETNSATLSLVTGWESDADLIAAFTNRAQLTVKVRFTGGNSGMLVVRLEP
jgi:hypothetical protein